MHIAIAPDRIVVLKLGKWKSVAKKHLVHCEAGLGNAPWESVLKELSGIKTTLGNGNTDVTVILSNHFVEYGVLPWSSDLVGAGEEEGYARHCFSQTYGPAAESWVFRVTECGNKKVRLVSAIDQSLLAGLHAALNIPKVRVRSIQPYLMAAFNRMYRAAKSDSGWFVVVEDGRACLALIDRCQWRRVRNIRIGFDIQDEIRQAIEREMCRSGEEVPVGKVWVFSPGTPGATWSGNGAWTFQPLTQPERRGFDPSRDGRFAMAMMG